MTWDRTTITLVSALSLVVVAVASSNVIRDWDSAVKVEVSRQVEQQNIRMDRTAQANAAKFASLEGNMSELKSQLAATTAAMNAVTQSIDRAVQEIKEDIKDLRQALVDENSRQDGGQRR